MIKLASHDFLHVGTRQAADIPIIKIVEHPKDSPKCLGYKIADYTPIINIHARAIRVEDSGNTYFCQREQRKLDT